MPLVGLDPVKRLDCEKRLWHSGIKKCQSGLDRQVLLVAKQKDCTRNEHQCRLINATFHPLWTDWDVLPHVYGCIGFYSRSHLDPVALH